MRTFWEGAAHPTVQARLPDETGPVVCMQNQVRLTSDLMKITSICEQWAVFTHKHKGKSGVLKETLVLSYRNCGWKPVAFKSRGLCFWSHLHCSFSSILTILFSFHLGPQGGSCVCYQGPSVKSLLMHFRVKHFMCSHYPSFWGRYFASANIICTMPAAYLLCKPLADIVCLLVYDMLWLIACLLSEFTVGLFCNFCLPVAKEREGLVCCLFLFYICGKDNVLTGVLAENWLFPPLTYFWSSAICLGIPSPLSLPWWGGICFFLCHAQQGIDSIVTFLRLVLLFKIPQTNHCILAHG